MKLFQSHFSPISAIHVNEILKAHSSLPTSPSRLFLLTLQMKEKTQSSNWKTVAAKNACNSACTNNHSSESFEYL